MNNSKSYLSLGQINERLAAENTALRNRIGRITKVEVQPFAPAFDSVYRQQYQFASAEVVENSVNRQKNFFTINKGKKEGMKPDMAVASGDCVAGVIVGCSENYSVVMSLLNIDFRLSARIRSNGYFGSLNWDGRKYNQAVLSEIPQHVSINVGDTVETTGFSAIFPEGMMVGTISEFEKTGGDFYRIRVNLATEFKKMHYVNVIGNLKKDEQKELEKQFQ
jgi:rod shape-determining protein MreC